MIRRQFMGSAAAALVGTLGSPALFAKPAFPDQPLTVVVPYTAGGSADFIARAAVERMAQLLRQPMVVDNRPGADGRIGMAKVLKAPADGYTLLSVTPVISVIDHLWPNADLRLADFVGIGGVATNPSVYVVPSELPIRSLAELLDHARAKPGLLNVPHPGRGSGIHIAQELFFQRAGLSVNSIPYKGQPPSITDLLAGNLSFGLFYQNLVLSHIQSGRLRVLATNAMERTRSLPNVPTLAELGYKDAVVEAWSGFAVSAKTPTSLVAQLADALREARTDKSVRARLEDMDLAMLDLDARPFTEFMARESERFGRLIRERGIVA